MMELGVSHQRGIGSWGVVLVAGVSTAGAAWSVLCSASALTLGWLLECERKWECLVECVQRRGIAEVL